MQELLGFAPDLPSTTPGILTDCENLVPTLTGFKAASQLQAVAYPPLGDECRGAASVLRLDNQRRFFAGTPTKLYEGVSNAWVDRSRVGGYTSGAENRWRFAQFGNVTLATNQADKIQASTGAGFDDIPEAPQARIIITTAGFVMAFATVHPTYGDMADMWWCSGLYDHTAWTPDQAKQSANGRFLDTPGEIRAAKTLGSMVVVYKESSMYIGQYVDPPVIWAWQPVPGEIGALSQEAVVDIDTAHVFIGSDDFWIYDGSRPASIGAPVRQWFFDRAHPSFLYRTHGYFDRVSGIVTWYFVSKQSSGELDNCIFYNTKTKRWGRAARTIQATVEYIATAVTYDDLGSLYATYDDISGIAYDSPQWFAGGATPAVFVGGELKLIGDVPMPCSLTTWDIGDDAAFTTITRLRCRFLSSPESAALQAYWKNGLGDALANGEIATFDDGKFDLLWSAHWHRLRLDFTGPVEITAVNPSLSLDGER